MVGIFYYSNFMTVASNERGVPMGFARPHLRPPLLNSPRPLRTSAFKQQSRCRTPPPGSLSLILQSNQTRSSPAKPLGCVKSNSSIKRRTFDGKDFSNIMDKFAPDQETKSPADKISYSSSQTSTLCVKFNDYQVQGSGLAEPNLLDSENRSILLQ